MKKIKTNFDTFSALTAALLIAIAICFGSAAQAQTLIVAEPEYQMQSRAIRVSPVDGISQTPLLNFTLTASGGDVLIKSIEANIHWASTASALYLYSGSTLVATIAAGDGHGGTFNVSTVIPQGMTVTYTLRADFGANTPSISPQIWTSIGTVRFEKPDGSQGFATERIHGNVMLFFTEAAEYSLAGTPSIQMSKLASGGSIIATFPLHVVALGNDVALPQSSDFTVRFTDLVSVDSLRATAVSVVTTPNNPITDGLAAPVTVTATLAGPNIRPDGMYVAKIESLRWTIGSTDQLQWWGLDNMATPATNVSAADMNALTVIASSFHDEQSSERFNSYGLTVIVPRGMAFSPEYSSDLATWSPAGFGFGSDWIATLHNGNSVFRGTLLVAPSVARRFYRVVGSK